MKLGQLIEYILHHILSMIFQEKCFSCYNQLIDQISVSDCLYFWSYWSICVSQLFVNQAVKSHILKLTLSFQSSRLATRSKSQEKNLNILRTKRAFKVKKTFFINVKGLSVAKNYVRPESVPLRKNWTHF